MPRGEAVHYRERAVEPGVPESAVLVGAKARSTGENILLYEPSPGRARRRHWRVSDVTLNGPSATATHGTTSDTASAARPDSQSRPPSSRRSR